MDYWEFHRLRRKVVLIVDGRGDEVAFVEYPIVIPLPHSMNGTWHAQVRGKLAMEPHRMNLVRALLNLPRTLLSILEFLPDDIVLLPLRHGKSHVRDEFYQRE